MNKITIIIISCLISSITHGQGVSSIIRKGNNSYKDSTSLTRYDDANILYLKALEQDSTNDKARYNLGNTFYRQQNLDDAIASYESVINNPKASKEAKFKAYHNLGNAYLQKKRISAKC